MRVLIAPDSFTGTLTAAQAGAAIAAGWQRSAPHDTVQVQPLSDGGPGFLDVLAAALDGDVISVTVSGPLGEPSPGAVLLADGPDGTPTGYVEAAQACGLHLVPVERRDPGQTTTAGVGELMLAARAAGARRIVVGIGGSATNDGGAGMLAALAGASAAGPHRAPPRLRGGGAGLRGLSRAEMSFLPELVADWAPIEVIAASDVDIQLLGFHGASAAFAAQKGATPEQAQELERALGDFAAAVCAVLDQPKLAGQPGAGAGGGLGFGLLALGGRRVSGVAAVLDAVRLADQVGAADLVITGEGRFDWQSLRGKVVAGVAHLASAVGAPVVVIAGQSEVGRREAQAAGIESVYPVAADPKQVAAALADPAGSLAARAERVARTWSPRRPGSAQPIEGAARTDGRPDGDVP